MLAARSRKELRIVTEKYLLDCEQVEPQLWNRHAPQKIVNRHSTSGNSLLWNLSDIQIHGQQPVSSLVSAPHLYVPCESMPVSSTRVMALAAWKIKLKALFCKWSCWKKRYSHIKYGIKGAHLASWPSSNF
jgi:hypothetical protein